MLLLSGPCQSAVICDARLSKLDSNTLPDISMQDKLILEYQTGMSRLGGWLTTFDLNVSILLTRYQHQNNIYGSIGEIGVHHGKYIIGLSLSAAPEEPVIAMDLFGHQTQNLDGSGRGDLQIFLNNARRFSPHTNFTVIEGNSMDITVKTFSTRSIPQFRFFSVDGGHFYDAALRDTKLAACSLHPGGIVSVDDILSDSWVGVSDAMFSYLRSPEATLVPFLMTPKKLYLTHPSMHQKYFDYLMSLGYDMVKCSAHKTNKMRYQIAEYDVCIVLTHA
jgi:hypothetical protein